MDNNENNVEDIVDEKTNDIIDNTGESLEKETVALSEEDNTTEESSLEKEEESNSQAQSVRTSNIDEIMGDVEFVMTREINPEEVEAELAKSKKAKAAKNAKKKAAEAAAIADVKPEERRALRRQKRKHDRRVAFIAFILILIVLVAAGIFGKGFVQNWWEERKAVVEPTPVAVEVVEEPEEIEEVPEIEFTPEIIEEPEEPEVVEPEETPEEIFDKMLDEMIAEMSLEDKVAGLFIITPEALTGQSNVTKAGDGTKAALEQYAIGGLIYSKSNITSADQIKEMIANTSSYSKYPLFFGVDEEGGDVTRVQSGLKLDKIPTAAELGEADDTVAVYDTYSGIANYLTEYGFNLDFAPVADTLTNSDNTSIGKRAFSTNSEIVAKMIPQAVLGLQNAGVSACLKHWPGQGNADADTHEGIATTDRNQEQMDQVEFAPFRAGIEAGVDMIMVSHISAPELTGDNTPCSLSKDVITGILRDEMDYDGIIITDALDMSAVSEYYGADEAAIKALKAGCDMILMPEDFVLAFDGVVAAVQNGTISEERINDCLKRVYRVKYADALSNELAE